MKNLYMRSITYYNIAFKASYYGQKGDEAQYGYSGIVYLTQKAIWFYSCTLMTSLHLVSKIITHLLSTHTYCDCSA